MNDTPQTEIDPIAVFPQVEKTLYQIAWKISQTTRLSFEDAKSEAFWAFMKACQSFRGDKGAKLNTWVYNKVRWHLYSHIKRTMNKDNRLVFIDPTLPTTVLRKEAAEAPAPVSEIIPEKRKGLSEEAREILSMLIETPREILELMPTTPEELLERIKEHFAFNRGYDDISVEITLHELRTHLEEAWA